MATSALLMVSAHCALLPALRSARLASSRGGRNLAMAGTFELDLFSPARISLFLRIVERTDDGFHQSASLFQSIGLGDRLQLARIPATRDTFAGVVRPSRTAEPIKQHVEFTTSPAGIAGLPTDQTNTVVRAIELFRTRLAERSLRWH